MTCLGTRIMRCIGTTILRCIGTRVMSPGVYQDYKNEANIGTIVLLIKLLMKLSRGVLALEK